MCIFLLIKKEIYPSLIVLLSFAVQRHARDHRMAMFIYRMQKIFFWQR